MPSDQTPIANIIVPLEIESLTQGSGEGLIVFGADLKKQYYLNADIHFRESETGSLDMLHLPINAALRRYAGQWKEIYDQDERFQQIGEVSRTPAWNVSPGDVRWLLSASIHATLALRFYDFVKKVRELYLDSHDVVLEIFGKSYVELGYPRNEGGVRQYGEVDFEISRFEAIYIVPKGGPTGSRYLS